MNNLSPFPKGYNDYSSYSKHHFNERVQKIAVDAGFTCPNRDGSKSTGGCTFCNNNTFNPFYCAPEKTVTQQLNEGIAFFSKKYKNQQYLAYFQAYSNTYAPLDRLKQLYEEALQVPGVIGLVIGTRPDCINDDLLNYLATLSASYYVIVEYGIESCYNDTLTLINRQHSMEDTIYAITQTAKKGILTGGHLILGLPNETPQMCIESASILSLLPLQFLKLHQLQIIKDTPIHQHFKEGKYSFISFTAETYIDTVVEFIEHLSPQIILERFASESPMNMVVHPKWDGIKNFELAHKIEKKLKEKNSWQGRLWNNSI